MSDRRNIAPLPLEGRGWGWGSADQGRTLSAIATQAEVGGESPPPLAPPLEGEGN